MKSNGKSGFCFRHTVKKTNDKGLGVFAGEAIKQGSLVWRHIPGQYLVYDEQSFKAAIGNLSRVDAAYELTHVFGLKEFPGCLVRVFDDGVLINHSGNANVVTNRAAASYITLSAASRDYIRNVTDALLDSRYALVATRDIEKGEEFTNDYAADTFDPPYYDVLCEQYGVSEEYF